MIQILIKRWAFYLRYCEKTSVNSNYGFCSHAELSVRAESLFLFAHSSIFKPKNQKSQVLLFEQRLAFNTVLWF
jgi:hypothetical protein